MACQYSPVIWTLHDMWALGDGEPYWPESEKFGRYESSPIRRIVKLKAEHGLVLTAPSRWLANLASELTGTKCHLLLNPVGLNIFAPENRAEARRRWGLPEEGLVVLAGADSLADPRKGFDLLQEAWGSAGRNETTLALFGRHGENRPGERYLGNVSSDKEMALAYQAADIYVHPARMENAPCQIQESLACGTPVLAFAVGGIPEMIQSGENGFLATELTGKSLKDCLNQALTDSKRLSEMRGKCRQSAEDLWEAGRLKKIFENLHLGLKGG